MLKPDDHAVADSPYVRETRLEGSTGHLCLRRVCAKGDDAVVHFKEFLRFSVPVLKVSEETREEATEHVVQSEINVGVVKTLDDFPAHVTVDNFPNNRRIAARLVKALYDGDVIVRPHLHTLVLLIAFGAAYHNVISPSRCGHCSAPVTSEIVETFCYPPGR